MLRKIIVVLPRAGDRDTCLRHLQTHELLLQIYIQKARQFWYTSHIEALSRRNPSQPRH